MSIMIKQGFFGVIAAAAVIIPAVCSAQVPPPAQTCSADALGNLHCMPCARVVIVRDDKGKVIANLCQ
jgi:hypothetical protein